MAKAQRTTNTTKSLVKGQIAAVHSALATHSRDEWGLAKQLYILKQMPLKLMNTSFSQVCRDEFDVSFNFICNRTTAYRQAKALGYTDAQLQAISKKVPFTRARKLIADLVLKITVKQFIAAAAAMKRAQFSSVSAAAVTPHGVTVRYQLWVDPKRAKKLDAELMKYGMVLQNHQRMGVTKAFAALIDNL